MINKTTSDTIVLLRVILSLFVVLIHTHLPNEIRTAAFEQYVEYLAVVLLSVAVPCFFFISSYLFNNSMSHAWNWASYKEKLQKRFKRLGVSYIGWNTAYILLCILGVYVSGKSIHMFFEHNRWWRMYWDGCIIYQPANIFGWPLTQKFPILGALWYVRDLLCMVVLSPVFYWVTKKFKYISLIFFTLLFLSVPWGIRPFLSPAAWYFWYLGAWICVHRIPFVPGRSKGITFTVLSIISALLLAWVGFEAPYHGNVLFFYKICSVFSIIYICACIASRIPVFPKWLLVLSEASFFVYCFHMFILKFAHRAVDFAACCVNCILDNNILTHFIKGGGVYLTSVACYLIYKKITATYKTHVSKRWKRKV